MDPGKQVFKMTAKSDLKKYAKLNGYSAEAWSTTSFIKHLSMRFKISEFELKQAIYKNKIRIHI
jgi:hypothetical protein